MAEDKHIESLVQEAQEAARKPMTFKDLKPHERAMLKAIGRVGQLNLVCFYVSSKVFSSSTNFLPFGDRLTLCLVRSIRSDCLTKRSNPGLFFQCQSLIAETFRDVDDSAKPVCSASSVMLCPSF